MTVEHIREAVLSEARREAEKITAEARARHDEWLEEARKKLDAEFERRFERARQQAEQESQHRIMRKRAHHNLALLRRRNEILDDLFRQAAGRLAGLSDEQYCAVVADWMQQAPHDGAGEVLCTGRDAERLAPLVEKLNRSREAGAQLTLTPADRPALGGVIFCTERFEVDLSLDTRIAHLREELAPETAAILFPSDITV